MGQYLLSRCIRKIYCRLQQIAALFINDIFCFGYFNKIGKLFRIKAFIFVILAPQPGKKLNKQTYKPYYRIGD